MGFLKWYKRDPRAALVGMHGLNLEQRGAYNTVLDLIYCHDGDLDDDDHFIAGHLRVDVRTWRRLKSELVAAGKLSTTNHKIYNDRAAKEVDAAQHRYRSASDAGTLSALKRGAKRFKFNGIASTAVPTPVATNYNQNIREAQTVPIETPKLNGHSSPTATITASSELAAIAKRRGWTP